MKKVRYIFLLLILLFIFFQLKHYHSSFKPNVKKGSTWDKLLNDVEVKHQYSEKHNALVPKPNFGSKLQAMNGKIITIRGFSMPVDMTGNVFVLSYSPSTRCFFCNGAGIESVIELNPKKGELFLFKRLKTDDYHEVKGRLRLNVNDYDHLIYILDEVEFMQLIKK